MILRKFRPFEAQDYTIINGEKYLYLNDDNPLISDKYNPKHIFIAQPNKIITDNTIVVPLMMTDEWQIISQDQCLLDDLRLSVKEYEFNFVGQCHYQNRSIFSDLNLQNYDYQCTQPVWSKSHQEKRASLISFLQRISKSKFVFCPRGIGSSSFRTYQSMSVGSVPIITGMNHYPFEDQVDWDAFSIRGDISNINQLIEKASRINKNEYENMRQAAINFWEQYCMHNSLYERLVTIVTTAITNKQI